MGDNLKEEISISCSTPSTNVDNTSFVAFENHTKGIGMNILTRIGYEGRGLRINGQGITNSIEVKA